MRKDRWTAEEEQYVIDHHETMTDKEMAENLPQRERSLPGRTTGAVESRRVKLGFGKYRKKGRKGAYLQKRDKYIPDRTKTRFAISGDHWDGFIGYNRTVTREGE